MPLITRRKSFPARWGISISCLECHEIGCRMCERLRAHNRGLKNQGLAHGRTMLFYGPINKDTVSTTNCENYPFDNYSTTSFSPWPLTMLEEVSNSSARSVKWIEEHVVAAAQSLEMKILLHLSEIEEDVERKARSMVVEVQRKVEAKFTYALHLAEHRLNTKWTRMHEEQEQRMRRCAQHAVIAAQRKVIELAGAAPKWSSLCMVCREDGKATCGSVLCRHVSICEFCMIAWVGQEQPKCLVCQDISVEFAYFGVAAP